MTERWDEHFERLVRESVGHKTSGGIEPDADLRGLGLDSTGLVALLINLEEAYQIEFPANRVSYANFTTPARLWQYVCTLRKS